MKRSKWKGPFIVKRSEIFHNRTPILPRDYEITSQTVGLTCSVYSGKKMIKLNLTNEMIGYKIGEFAPTREKFEFKKKKKK